MEPLRDDQLIADLQTLRPTPRPQFAAELDERAAAGFPRRSRLPRLSFGRLLALPLRRQLIAAGGVAVLLIAIAGVLGVVSRENSSPSSESGLLSLITEAPDDAGSSSEASGTADAAEGEALPSEGLSEEKSGAVVAPVDKAPHASIRHRDVERSASLTLGADPADVADDSAEVFEVVRTHRGIVLRSTTKQGPDSPAEARFDLLVPSARLGDALADLSAIDEVRSRHESTADITAPTVGAAELLQDSRARIDSLLGQLEEAEVESEREVVEAELRHERRHAARLAARLDRLNRRADFSQVSLLIVAAAPDSNSGSWGVDDAFHDAGRILAVAAAGLVVALAILGPIALFAFLAWLTHRAWVRRERRRALS